MFLVTLLSRGLQSYLKRTGVAAGFHSSQIGDTVESCLEAKMIKLIKQVETGVSPDWLELKPAAASVLQARLQTSALEPYT